MSLEDTIISIKQRDTYRIRMRLLDPETGEPYDLSDANEVRLYVEHGRSEDLVVDSPVEIIDAEAGEVAYDLSRAETARSGTHRAEFEIDESSDGEDDYTTVPDDGYVRIDVTRMLNREVDAEPADVRGDWEVTRVTATESVRSPAGRFAEQLGFPVYTADEDAPRETGYFNETDGQLKYKDRGGGVHAGDGGLLAGEDFDGQGESSFTNLASVGVDDADITDINVSGEVNGNVGRAGRLGFHAEQIGTPFTDDDYSDPTVFHRRHFDDGLYRVLLWYAGDTHELYTTPDFESFTQVSSDIGLAFNAPQAGFVTDDGTFVLYGNDAGGTTVLTGDSLTSMSEVGNVISERDVGVFYDGDDETVHLYPQDPDYATGADSKVINHFTTPIDDLLNATQQEDAIDLTSENWGTGDLGFIEVGNYYYAFGDHLREGRPQNEYNIALFRSEDLYDWTTVRKSIADGSAGDMKVVRYGSLFKAVTEFSGPIGVWDVIPSTDPINVDTVQLTEGNTRYPKQWMTLPTDLYAIKNLDSGLIADYGFNAGRGDTLFDATLNNNHGAINGATWTETERGQALSFDRAAGDVVDLGTAGPDVQGLSEFTVGAVVDFADVNDSQDNYIVNLQGFSIRLRKDANNNIVGQFYSDSGSHTVLTDKATSPWTGVTPITMTYDGDALKLYLGSEMVAVESGLSESVRADLAGEPSKIGAKFDDTSHFDGDIMSVFVYDRALSDSEVNAKVLDLGKRVSGDLVSQDELSNVYDYICHDTQDFVEALEAAEQTPGLQIKLGSNTYAPYDEVDSSRTFSLEEATTIVGNNPGHDVSANNGSHPAPDRLIPDEGTEINLGGNGPLLDLTGVTGVKLEGLGFRDYSTAITGGVEATDSSWEYGAREATFEDLAFYDGSDGADYAIDVANIQRLRMDKVVVAESYGIHTSAETDGFQPGNSVWTDVHVTPPDTAEPAIHINPKNYSINYIDMIRPQVIEHGDGTGAAVKLDGVSGGRCNNIIMQGADIEGTYARYVDCIYASECAIELSSNGDAADTAVNFDANSQYNWLKSATAEHSPHSENASNRLTGAVSDPTGDWWGSVFNAGSSRYEQYLGRDVSSYFMALESPQTFIMNNLELQGIKSIRQDDRPLGVISGTEGEIAKHDGNDGNPAGNYEWDPDNDQWVGFGLASGTTITPS